MTAGNERKVPRAAHKIARPPILKIYGLQCALVLLSSFILFPVDKVMAYSAVIGGMISVVPNAYFARQVFRYTGAAFARDVARSFYRGESGKFVTTVMLFAATFALVQPLQVFVLFLAYLIVMLLNAVILARYALRGNRI
ncbi:ATP synthase subunit I [uncultured Zhongshania sp.]|jgi:ATP synthase protein I|uniref:ATP synthase subunit I n=1 Tax=uncultured Zhongshania sp. TaxID=1642288 RepID=UPI0025E729E7|nr:ATP synthase subunit I [uncultured Zhongshania sp.]